MKILDIELDADYSLIKRIFANAFQSSNLSFLIGAGSSYPAIETLSGFETEIEELLEKGDTTRAEKKHFDFIKKIFYANSLLINSECTETKDVLNNYINFIQIIHNILLNRNSQNIGKRFATIFTTNYDLFLECACENVGETLSYSDGFKNKNNIFLDSVIDISEFDKIIFSKSNLYNYKFETPRINIVKLHGSVNWSLENVDKIKYADYMELYNNIIHTDVSNHECIKSILNKIGMVKPSHHKHKDTVLNRTYFNLLRFFSNNLLMEHSLLISFGFSFDDSHIRKIVIDSLQENPTLMLMAIAYNNDDVEKFKKYFMGYNIIILKTQTDQFNFSKFNELLYKIFEEFVDNEN